MTRIFLIGLSCHGSVLERNEMRPKSNTPLESSRRISEDCKNTTRLMSSMLHSFQAIGLALSATFIFSHPVSADSWPQWRGPNQDGKSQETGLLNEWPEEGPPLLWKISDLGEGYATPSVDQGKIFGASYEGDEEFAWALNEENGELIWKTRTAKAERDVGYSHGPRSSPTVEGQHVFTLGAGGDLTCLNVDQGTIVWQRNIKEDFDGKMMSGWGYSESVLVDGERVVCSPGGRKGTVVCLNRADGKLIWRTTELKDEAAYTSIVKEAIHGKVQYLTLTGDSLAGISPSTGKLLWKAKRRGKTAVIPTPIYHDGSVFVTSGYNVGCNLFDITKRGERFRVDERYANRDIKNHHGGAIRVGDHIYASSGPILVCMELKTGDVKWEQRSVGKGSLSYADGHLYLRSEKGPIALIEANPSAYVEKGRFKQPDRSRRQSWAHPVIANGRLILRDQNSLFSYDLKPQR